MNKVEIKNFLGSEVRVVNNEYIVLKDMFNALGRVKEDGTWTDEKKKLEKIIGKENIVKLKISYNNKTNNKARNTQYVLCAKIDILEKYDIESLFKKGVICTKYREEHSFISLIEDFFKYDKHISLEKQFPILEYKVDLAIGTNVFVEFDEKHHKNQTQEDMERMQKISLANTYRDGYLHNTNKYEEQKSIINKYDGFTTYDFNGAFFIRVFDKKCLSWIPFVYGKYIEFPDLLDEKPTPYVGHSSELISLKYSC